MKVSLFSQISIDGKLAVGPDGSSRELINMLSDDEIQYIHQFRGQVDGIMVGRCTVDADNPSLTNRYEEGNNPLRIIPSRSLRVPTDCTLLNDDEPTLFVTTAAMVTATTKTRPSAHTACGASDSVKPPMRFPSA